MSFKNISELFLRKRIISKAALDYFQDKENSKNFSSNLFQERKTSKPILSDFSQPYEAPRPKKQLQQDLDLDIVMVDILSAFSGTISKTYNTWGIW